MRFLLPGLDLFQFMNLKKFQLKKNLKIVDVPVLKVHFALDVELVCSLNCLR